MIQKSLEYVLETTISEIDFIDEMIAAHVKQKLKVPKYLLARKLELAAIANMQKMKSN